MDFKKVNYYDNIGYNVFRSKKNIGRLKLYEDDWVYYPMNEFGIGSTSLSTSEMQEILEFIENLYN
jgi:hypothetical protein